MNIKTSLLSAALNDHNLDATGFMQRLRQQFASNGQQDDFFIADALKTVHFDGSLDSFHRLDAMFISYKKQMGVLAFDFMQEPRKMNTLLVIASYVGCFISKKLGINELWHNNKQVKNPARLEPLYPNDAINAYSLNCNQHTILPIQFVISQFCEAHPKLSISQEIESTILNQQVIRAEETGLHTDEMHAIQKIYQKQYPLFVGSSYQALIDRSKLDYSINSLERFDDLMRELREHHIRHPDEFLSQPTNYYFVLFLCGYLGQVIAQEAHAHLEWLNPTQVNKLYKQNLADELRNCRSAHINSNILHVSQHIFDFLFSPMIKRTSKKYTLTKLSELKSPHYPIRLVLDTRTHSNKFKTSPYCATLYQAGLLTGYLLQQLHGVFPPYSSKEILVPTSYPAGTTIFQHAEGLEKALRLFETNLEHYPYNVLGYKTTACLPHLKCDAIGLDIFHQGKYPIRLHLVIPYISSFDYRGFHILRPYIQAQEPKTEQHIEKILQTMGAFFDGIDSFESTYPEGIRNWHKYYRPLQFPYPKTMHSDQPMIYQL